MSWVLKKHLLEVLIAVFIFGFKKRTHYFERAKSRGKGMIPFDFIKNSWMGSDLRVAIFMSYWMVWVFDDYGKREKGLFMNNMTVVLSSVGWFVEFFGDCCERGQIIQRFPLFVDWLIDYFLILCPFRICFDFNFSYH